MNVTHTFPGDLDITLVVGSYFATISSYQGGGQVDAFAGVTWSDQYPSVTTYGFNLDSGVVPYLSSQDSLWNIGFPDSSSEYVGLCILVANDYYPFSDEGVLNSFSVEIDNLDQCEGSPCIVGDCTDGFLSYTCSCPDDYTFDEGLQACVAIDYCSPNPCFNGGACAADPAPYTCTCTGSFFGDLCQFDSCSSSDSGFTCTTLPSATASLGSLHYSQIRVTGGSPVYLGSTLLVQLTTNITHPYPGDLEITLISPSATQALVSKYRGRGSANLFAGTVWEDASPVPVSTVGGGATSATSLRPERAFTIFNNEDVTGDWTLQIIDSYTGSDAGTLVSWGLTFQEVSYCEVTPDPCNNHGTCYHDQCFCDIGYFGAYCDTLGGGTTLTEVIPYSNPRLHFRFSNPSPGQDVSGDSSPTVLTYSPLLPVVSFLRADGDTSNTALILPPTELLVSSVTFTVPSEFIVELVFSLERFPPTTATIFSFALDTDGLSILFSLKLSPTGLVSASGQSSEFVASSQQLTLGTNTHVVFARTTTGGNQYKLAVNGETPVTETFTTDESLADVYFVIGGGLGARIDEAALYYFPLSDYAAREGDILAHSALVVS